LVTLLIRVKPQRIEVHNTIKKIKQAAYRAESKPQAAAATYTTANSRNVVIGS